MARKSRSAMFRQLKDLESVRDDLPKLTVENIFASNGEDTGIHETDEALFRLALEVKIHRLKWKLCGQEDVY